MSTKHEKQSLNSKIIAIPEMCADRPRRLMIVIYSMAGGGAERVVLDLMRQFVGSGVNVTLALSQQEGELLKEVPPEVTVVKIGDVMGIRNIFRARRAVTRIIREQRPDTILCNMTSMNRDLLRIKLQLRRFPRLVIVEHTETSKRLLQKSGLLIKALRRTEVGILYRAANAIIAVSQGVADDLVGNFILPRSKISVIGNPIDVSRIREANSVEPDQQLTDWFDGLERPVIISAGRLHPVKGFNDLVRAFSLYSKQRPGTLVIFGDGPELRTLQALARELGVQARVHFRPYCKDVLWYVRRSDLFALTSHAEGFGNVLVEALACDIPVVATSTSGAKDIVHSSEQGRLVPISDVQGISVAIDEVLCAPPEAPNRASEYLLKDLDPAKIAAEYMSLLFPPRV